jgi:predicted metalloprotease with PDZ domain
MFASVAGAQHPLRHFTDGVDVRWSRSQPRLYYALDIADGDTTGFDVRMSVINAPDTFRIAMAKHPEYDDRFFRYVTNLRVESQRPATIVQEDSALWRVVAPGGNASISYRIQLPPTQPPPRAAWRPFLSPTGGLTGGPHAFMYVVGAELAPAHVSVRVPTDWGIATGLTPTSEPRTFFASNAYVLVESPILVGRYRQYWFPIDGVPHHIAHWIAPGSVPFDTMAFINGVERMANEVVRLFGRAPYREFTFQFQDNAYGGLEHHNSVSLGTPSAELARNPNAVLPEIAHEFIHTWNLMRIRPVQYTGVTYTAIQPVPTLWFSEGLTMMYADVVLRRAKLPTFDSTRSAHLAGLITRYFAQPGNSRFAAEQVSRVAYNAPPDALGDYDASTHLQGELLGTMLDLIIRDATNGRRSMDDVMRLMLDRFSGERGFTGPDVERTVGDVCGCSVRAFFDAHVRGAPPRPIPFDRYLGLIGMRAVMTHQPALRDGQPAVDLRIRAWNPPDSSLSLIITDPRSVWGSAGLHSGDRVMSVNGQTPRAWLEFRQIVGRSRIGDTLRFVVRAPDATAPRNVMVVVAGYDRPAVRIEPLPSATEKQRKLRDAWLNSTP